MKKALGVILLIPFILPFLLIDIIKLPLMIFVIPFSFLFFLSYGLLGEGYWFRYWIGFNLEFGFITYPITREMLGC